MYKLLSHDYFMDSLQITEIPILNKYLKFADVLSWQQTREIMLSVLRPYLKKKDLTSQELFPLPIDDDGSEHGPEISNEDVNWFKKFKENYKKKKG